MPHHEMLQKVEMYSECMNDTNAFSWQLLMYSRLDGVTPVQQSSSAGNKRKSTFETPSVPKFSKAHAMSSPSDGRSLPSRADQDGIQ